MLELSNPSATALSTMAAALELLCSQCCGNAAGRAQQRHQSPLNEHPLPEVSVGRWRPSRDGIGAPQQILLDAVAQRAALAENWPSAAQVSAQLCSRPQSGEHNASQLRRENRLLGVYLMHPLPSYRYPSWQFRSDGQPVDHLVELLGVLRDFGPFQRESGGLRRSAGWGEVEWFRSPHALLDGATPAAMLTTDRPVTACCSRRFRERLLAWLEAEYAPTLLAKPPALLGSRLIVLKGEYLGKRAQRVKGSVPHGP